MKTKVQNRLFGKIIRTIGYVLLLLSALILAVTAFIIFAKTISIDGNATVAKINEIVDSLKIPNLIFYSNLAMLVGLLLVAWALGRSIFGKVIYTILLIIMLVYLILGPSFAKIYLSGPQPDYLQTFVAKNGQWFIDFNNTLEPGLIGGIVTLVFTIATVTIIGGKKPAGISNKLVGGGMVFLVFFTVVTNILPQALANVEGLESFFVSKVFFIITQALHALGFLFVALGSLFGTIFFFKR